MSISVEAAAITPVRSERGGVGELAWLAFPAVLQTLSDTLMQVIDAAIVGRLGVVHLGAIGFGGIWVWTLVCVFVGTGTGVQTFVAQAFGAGQRRQCGHWPWQAIYSLMPIAIVWMILLVIWFEPLLRLLGASPELSRLASEYARPRLLGAPALIPSIAFSAFFRGLGDTHTPLRVMLISVFVNFILAYGLVLGHFGLPQLGIAGAGIATAIANWTYAFSITYFALRKKMRRQFGTVPGPARRHDMRRFAWTSIPVGGQWVLDMTSFAVFSTMIARMGATSMAANQAMIQLLSLAFMQAVGVSIATAALVGQCIGARDFDSAERAYRSSLKLGMGLSAVVAVLFLAIPEQLLHVFTDDPGVLALGRPLLALGALFQFIDVAGIIVSGALRGAGDTRFPFVAQTLLAWFLRLPLVYLIAIHWNGGVTGAWFGELGYLIVLATVEWWRFRSGAWRRIRI